MNSLLFGGLVVREPHYSNTGKSPALSFTLCSTKAWKDKEFKTYCEVVVFGDRANSLNTTIAVSDYLLCQGEASAETYEHSGEKKSKLRMVANSVEVVSKTVGQRPATKRAVSDVPPGSPAASAGGKLDSDDPDSVPF